MFCCIDSFFFFFFKQKTAYEMRISDWSSDVCSSDLAIGSRLNAEVAALKQASVNAGQAVSMLQIADGAMSKVQDILVRMKTLAVQAGSGQLSGTERGMLDTEYQSLVSEIDRISSDTEFNGNQLVNGSITISSKDTFVASGGVVNLAVSGVSYGGTAGSASNAATLNYASGTSGGTVTMTASDAVTGGTVNYTTTIASSEWDTATGYLSTGTSLKLTNTASDGFATISLN